MEEKKALKSVLFQFAETFGHPGTEEEKNVTKDIYDRYLSIKRLIRKNSANVNLFYIQANFNLKSSPLQPPAPIIKLIKNMS